MILHELRSDEPFRLLLELGPGLTVVTGLGPERRAWLTAAVAQALAGRRTPLWGIVEFVGLRVDLDDPLVVRATAGVDPVIGPGLWRSDPDDQELASDDLWPTSSLPERTAPNGHRNGGSLNGGHHPSPPDLVLAASSPTPPPAAGSAAGVRPARRRWGRPATSTDEADVAPFQLAPAPGGADVPHAPPPVESPPEVPSVDVPDPPRPAILDGSGPPVPEPPVLPDRPAGASDATPGNSVVPPRPPRPAVLDHPVPADPGPRPAPPVLPPAPGSSVDVDEGRSEQRVRELAAELADRHAELASARAAAAAIVVPPVGDLAPVAAALAEVEHLWVEEEAMAVEARSLAERWVEAEEAAAQARLSITPHWLLELAEAGLARAAEQVEAARAGLEAGPPLDRSLVERLDAAHREVVDLESGPLRRKAARRQLEAARHDEAELLRQLGLADHASLECRLTADQQVAASAERLNLALADLADAEAMWAELQAPRDAAAAGAAAAGLAAVWVEVTAFLGAEPSDVPAALAVPRPPNPRWAGAVAALASALEANGVAAPSVDDLCDVARAWLNGADRRAVAAEAAVAEVRSAADAVRRCEEAADAAAQRHADAAATCAAAAAVRLVAADLVHQEALACWRQEVADAEVAHADAVERWAAAVVEHGQALAARHEVAAAHDLALARHAEAVAVAEQDRVAGLDRVEQEWEAAVAALRTEHDRRLAERAAWEEARAEAEAAWEAELAEVAAERQRLEALRDDALEALAEWEERRRPAPEAAALEAMLLQRLEANATRGAAGAVPVVVDDALSSLPAHIAAPLFEVFVRISATAQVVYLSDDPTIAEAARRWGSSLVTVAPER